jgi:sugar/nucleoside kinase (ribokinase family)
MNGSRVAQLLNQFSGKRILIAGDVMLDEFIWGKVARISPEAPVPVVEVVDETYRLGGSGNVAANIHALGGVAIPIGIVGRDSAGDRVLDLMKQSEVETADLPARTRNDVVVVRVLVSRTGHPFHVSLLRGSRLGRSSDDAVVAAVMQWTFSPARKRGEPVNCWYNIGVPLGQAD